MACVLVDYENVYGTYGMKGVEALGENDILILFYSQSCAKIRTDYLEAIIKSTCKFQSYKLVKPGKNALDFYIAVMCGILSEQGENQMVIVSNDKGFSAIIDFFSAAKSNETKDIVLAANIEKGLSLLNTSDNEERRKIVQKQMKMLDIEMGQIYYKENRDIRIKIQAAFEKTSYVAMIDKIMEYVIDNKKNTLRKKYTDALHRFGKLKASCIL